VRAQLGGLIAELGTADLTPMSLGLSHSLSRYKLKFSPEKVDTMIVQVRGQGAGFVITLSQTLPYSPNVSSLATADCHGNSSLATAHLSQCQHLGNS
jgi:hypothetical protein